MISFKDFPQGKNIFAYYIEKSRSNIYIQIFNILDTWDSSLNMQYFISDHFY